jgi:tRNA(Ile)-lysidine synthetase-like protein
MRVDILPGKYVLAVSGGVDSIVLLDLLAKKPDIELIVAHFNHGMRPDSAEDELFVEAAAKRLKRPFECGYGHLGEAASEEAARQTRYRFLESVKGRYAAEAIVTAHHQDDMVETALLNLLRGSGYRGLTAISANKRIVRPLLGYSKDRVYEYAKKQSLKWLEDPTNQNNDYLRNYLRNILMPKLTPRQKSSIILNIDKVANIENVMTSEIANLSHIICDESIIDRSKFINLPIDLGNELIVFWLRRNKMLHYDKKTVNRVSDALRTSKHGTICHVKGGLKVEINSKSAQFSNTL